MFKLSTQLNIKYYFNSLSFNASHSKTVNFIFLYDKFYFIISTFHVYSRFLVNLLLFSVFKSPNNQFFSSFLFRTHQFFPFYFPTNIFYSLYIFIQFMFMLYVQMPEEYWEKIKNIFMYSIHCEYKGSTCFVKK